MKSRLLAFAALVLFASQSNASVIQLVSNGGFETGDLTSWTTTGLGITGTCPIDPRDWNVSTLGSSTGCTPAQNPFSGNYAVYNMYDGPANTNYQLRQSIAVPTSLVGADLSWVDSDAASYSGLSRTFSVDFYDSLGTTLLGNAYTLAVPFSDANTSWNARSFNVLGILSAYQGSTVQLRYTVSIPETWTGPAGLGVDNISLQAETRDGVIPEPTSFAIFALGTVGLIFGIRRRR